VLLSPRICAPLGLAAAFVVLSASVSTLLLVPRYSKPLAIADVGTVAPEFQLPDLDGQTFNLSDSRGQVVVLFFSALNDPLLPAHYENVDRLAREYADDARVKFLGINIAHGQSDIRVAARSFPMLMDDNSNVASRYSATASPLMVIIDPHGVVRYRGPSETPFITQAIRTLAENATLAVAK
jgi:peroxiredoxin